MDSVAYIILILIIGVLVYLLDQEKKVNAKMQQKYIDQFKDMSDKIYFRKTEELVQTRAIEQDEAPFMKNNEEKMVPFEESGLTVEQMMEAMSKK